MNIKVRLTWILWFLTSAAGVSAQPQHSPEVLLPDSLLFTDTIPTADSMVFYDNPALNEDLNDFFSEKMDSLVHTWFIENAFHPDSLEIKYSETFPVDLHDSVYIRRLKDAQQVIDLSYNDVVKNFIKMYTERKRGQVEIMLGLSNYYFPIFEETLDKYDLPLELKYLPIIESALNPKAISRMGANGLWQFMFGTGKNMKLEINSFVDERRDPLKSTDAAARYLKQLYDMYGDWHLAIAAYNCGPGNVNRAIKRSGDKTNYWEIYYRLPRETRGYVPAYIAAAYVMNYYSEHNLVPRVPDMSLLSDTLVINKYLHFDQVAANLNIDKEELRTLNPMYRRDIIPAKKDKPYPIILPKNKIMEFMSKDSLIFAHERDKFFPDNTLVTPSENSGSYFTPVDIKGKAKIFYTVKQGDNPGYIAAWFKVRTADLNYWNNINRNMIRVGQKLVVYVPENQKDKFEKINEMTFAQKQEMIGKSTTTNPVKPEVLDPNYDYYTVKKGDTLMEIARQYAGITSSEIMQLNNLNSDRNLYIGQKLKIRRKS